MPKYHAVMIDETGCEFGVERVAATKADAINQIEEDYPESRIDQILSEEEDEQRRRDIQSYAERCLDDPYYDIDMDGRW